MVKRCRISHPGRNAARLYGNENGAAGILVVVMLPVLVLAFAFVADGGGVLLRRSLAFAVADVAALAGVQELDLERLIQGDRWIIPDAATTRATEVAEAALWENGIGSSDRVVRVRVINASQVAPRKHPVTGRTLRDPTVSVEVKLRVPLNLTNANGGAGVWVTGQADASVLPRRD